MTPGGSVRRRPPAVGLLGSTTRQTAYSLINRRWVQGLEAAGCTVMQGRSSEDLEGRVEVVIHHDFEAEFSSLRPTAGVSLAAVRPWDFGPYPPNWAAIINDRCTQLWVHTNWLARKAEEGGVRPDRVRVVPLGCDADVFTPHGESFPLATGKSFHFLFVGATVHRKGIDVLLAAYRQEFAPHDDVCLVIKDWSGDVFYRHISYRDEILEVAADPDAPEILHLDRYMSDRELTALRRSCDVGVFPYRAEGFCLPILETMASGRPVIVPGFGACLDFCRPEFSYHLPVRRISLPISRRVAINKLGFDEEVDEVDFCEVGVDALAAQMREAYEAPPEDRARKGERARRFAAENFSWQASVDRVLECLEEMR